MKTVHLHGVLADKFGKYFNLDVESAKEAMHAISCQIPAFKAFMLQADVNRMGFALFLDAADGRNIGEDEFGNITSSANIHVVPVIEGAGGDVWQVIAGVVLVGLSFTPFGAPFAPALQGAGLGLILGGVAAMLMPTPKMENSDQDGNRANYGFGQAVTTTTQGNPVPVLYGERRIGGFVMSAGIFTEDTQ